MIASVQIWEKWTKIHTQNVLDKTEKLEWSWSHLKHIIHEKSEICSYDSSVNSHNSAQNKTGDSGICGDYAIHC